MQSLTNKLQTVNSLRNIRCTGTIIAVDVVTNEETSYFNTLRDKLYHFFLSKGILLRPLGNTVYIMPPYCISDDDLNYIGHYLELAIKS